MSVSSKSHQRVVQMVQLAMLTAIVFVLQLFVRLPMPGTSVNLVLIPIALGAMILGPAAGAWLGFVCGMIIYVYYGVMGTDPFTGFLFANNPYITAGICLVKSTLAGFLAGWVYRLLHKRNELLAVFLAAAIVPLVNTGVFVLGCLIILDTITAYISVKELGMGALYFIFIGCAGINFILEFIVNMVFSPALERIVRIVNKMIRK